MDIYSLLPNELQTKIKYYVLSHPTAEIIREQIAELRCDEFYTIRDQQGKIFFKADGRDFFCDEYFRRLKKAKSYDLTVWGDALSHSDSESGTISSEEDSDGWFERLFNVSSSSTSDDD